ncbi:lytic transglycosylase domain-containing protein [uncultured Thiothrix sp.]|uniref:lytic transglycosylase domain-containing protein n=1 Tax=uncultured Thiothrix sp. TaxID=223185 RepID=UPI0026070BC4|nr:lytic transglycosylase domain-containing protein [uncultured Thiothrix sp.]
MRIISSRLARFGLGLYLLLVLPSSWASHETPESSAAMHPCARMSVKTLDKRAAPYQETIQKYATQYQVSEAVIKAVIAIESCYNQQAESPKGAQGLMQLIPETAERFGVADSMDSHQNIQGGTRYLAWLWKRFDGDLTKVLAAYNAGEGRVDQYQGIPPYRETQDYVRNVMFVHDKLAGVEARSKDETSFKDEVITPNPTVFFQTSVMKADNPPVTVRRANFTQTVSPVPRRVVAVFESPFKVTRPTKPGRAGLWANKARAPQLYKH